MNEPIADHRRGWLDAKNPRCLAEINAGTDRASEELVFLHGLLVDLLGDVDPFADFAVSLGFADVYRNPALGADNFIRVHKVPEDLAELIATLRALTAECVHHLIETAARHGESPVPERLRTAAEPTPSR